MQIEYGFFFRGERVKSLKNDEIFSKKKKMGKKFIEV